MLDKNPQKAAEYLDDMRISKMIVESFQLLSTAHRVLDGKKNYDYSNGHKKAVWSLSDSREGILYKATHVNHPSNLWVRATSANYLWLVEYTHCLVEEYYRRFKKTHKSESLFPWVNAYPNNIYIYYFTTPRLAMPEQYQSKDFVEAYRNYFNGEKLFPRNKPATWRTRNTPFWVNQQFKENYKEIA